MAPNSDNVRLRHGFDDLIWTEIICRLPSTKCVFQCKCVSKHWKSLISDQYFIDRFIDYHHEKYGTDFNPDHQLMLINYCSWKKREDIVFSASLGDEDSKQLRLLRLPLPPDEVRRQCYIKSSYNDLLLVSRGMGSQATYLVVNLFTKEHVELPLCDSPGMPPDESNEVGFVCEPFYRQGARQLDLNSNYRYRVVRIMYKGFQIRSIATYYSETKQWSELTGLDPDEYLCHSSVVAHGRKLYWFNLMENVVAYDPFVATGGSRFNFLRFDKAPMLYECYDYKLVESQGSLLMIELTKEGHDRYLSIWKLKERDGRGDDEAFIFELRVMIDPITPHTSISPKVNDSEFLQVLSVHPSNQDIIFLSPYNTPRVATFNLRTKEWRVVGEEIEGTNSAFGVPAALPWWPTPIH